jgi:small multidrug resistance pump
MHYVFLMIAIVCETTATSLLPKTEGFTRLVPSLLVVTGYATAFYCLSRALKVLPVGVAYAIWSGAGIVLVSLVAWVWLKQSLDVPAIVGIGLILAGVLVINLLSKSTAN